MAAYLISTYNVVDPEGYAKYNPGAIGVVMETIMRHGGELMAAGPADTVEGDAKHAHVMIKFPNKEAAHAWITDPDYVAVKHHRLDSASDTHTVIVDHFTPPGG